MATVAAPQAPASATPRDPYMPFRTFPEQHKALGMILNNPIHYLTSRIGMFGDMFRLRFYYTRPMYFTINADVVQHVLQENHRNYTKGDMYQQLGLLLGNGLLVSEGEFWLRQRRIAQPAFHRKRLAGMADDMTAAGLVMIDRLRPYAASGQPLDIAKEMMRVTLDVVCRTMFSADLAQHAETVDRAFSAANEGINKRVIRPVNVPMFMPTAENRKLREAIGILHKLMDDTIADRRREPNRHDDLLTMLMQTEDADTGERMNDRQLRDELITIFLAGHETSANALTWCLYLLSQNPEIEQRLRHEVNAALPDGKTPGFDDLPRLGYVSQVIQEAMRLYPPAWSVVRNAKQDDVAAGYRIRRGHNVFISVYHLHRNPQHWPDPERFDPERFGPDAPKDRHRFAYMPFGGGPRLCIGNNFALMEMQLLLAMLVQNFRWAHRLGHRVELEPLITLRPKHGIELVLQKASASSR